MSQSAPPNPKLPDDSLPPVEPPSARFILQLFLVPGLIVIIIVMVWMMFSWLATKGQNPRETIAKLKVPNAARWQHAMELANVIRGGNHSQFKRDPRAAQELAQILEDEVETGSSDEKSVLLRVFLSRALGEFYVEEGLDELLYTAQSDRSRDVRLAAIEAVAVRIENAGDSWRKMRLNDPGFISALLKLSEDSQPTVRSRAAMAMGAAGTAPLIERLEEMADDTYPDARYNAATALARHGNTAAMPVLVEMLDPTEMAGLTIEQDKSESAQEEKRILILVNAIRATRLLAERNPQADLTPLVQATGELAEADVQQQIRAMARDAHLSLQNRPATAP
ncbi:MAG: HEAT repeat domain-containing protein [Pirellulales bacterium]